LELGEATQVLAALTIAAGPEQKFKTFAAKGKLAGIACCSEKTIQRALAVNGPLVTGGWVKRHGREHGPAGGRKRRTVSFSLTRKTVEAFDEKYHTLPRSIVLDAQANGDPMTWAERVLLSLLVSRHELVERIAGDDQSGGCADERLFFSLRELRLQTGLVNETLVAARRNLIASGMIEAGEHYSEQRGFEVPVHGFLRNWSSLAAVCIV
jgi:hypothetical protein